ncbi:MAG: TatD family hydrolase [Crocinitomicaceae bacterium]|nr:TatD family hydrolase [Crocinitomicaceae bacterium]
MYFVDTHTHLFIERSVEEGDLAVKEAIDAGVKQLLLPNIDLESIPDLHALCNSNPASCFPMMGLHPCSVKEDWEEVLNHMYPLFSERKYVAVGELGLDLYWDKTTLNHQIAAFKKQVEWAKELDLPIVIHVRDAFDEIFEVMDEVNDDRLRGVFHCFTGNIDQAKKVMEYGDFYMGMGGVLTFKNSGVDKTVVDIPLEYLILETDSPYLAPTPHRGKRNESKYIPLIAEKLADVKQVSLQEITNITSKNAIDLFRLPIAK